MLTGRIPDGTIAIDEWERTGCLVRDDPAFGNRRASKRQHEVSPLPAAGKLIERKKTHFSAIGSTSAPRPLSCVGGGMDPEVNTESSGHSDSVSASASVPSSQLRVVRQLTVIVKEGSGRGQTCESRCL